MIVSSLAQVGLINVLPVNEACRIVVDSAGLLFNGVNVAVLSSLVVDEEKNALDNDGDIYSDNDCSI